MSQEIHALAVELFASGPTSIAVITAEAIKRKTPIHSPGHQCENDESAIASTVENEVFTLGCSPVLDTPDKVTAYAMKGRECCFDSWPTGQEDGYRIYDSILWTAPEGVEKIVPFEVSR